VVRTENDVSNHLKAKGHLLEIFTDEMKDFQARERGFIALTRERDSHGGGN